MDTVFKIIAVGVITYCILSKIGTSVTGCLTFNRPRVDWEGFSSRGVRLNVQLLIVNTNPVPIPVDRTICVLRYGSKVVANLNAVSQFSVKANSEFTVPVQATILFDQVSSSIINTNQYLLNLTLQGVVTSGPLSYEVNLRVL